MNASFENPSADGAPPPKQIMNHCQKLIAVESPLSWKFHNTADGNGPLGHKHARLRPPGCVRRDTKHFVRGWVCLAITTTTAEPFLGRDAPLREWRP